jgi:TonB family protein
MQRCDDAQSDPRADIEASRDLGVRSVMILPLLQNNELVGLFEVFSPSASVFGERDERTLDALSQLALANLQRASEPPALAGIENALATEAAGSYTGCDERSSSSAEYDSGGAILPPTVNENFSARSINVLTWVMGSLVFAAAGLLVVMVSGRLGAGTFAARAHERSTVSAPLSRPNNQAIGAGSSPEEAAGTTANRANANETSRARPSEFSRAVPASTDARAREQSPPAGSLLVYQGGKEIFRLPPTVENNVAGNQAQLNHSPATGEIGAGRQSGPGIEAAAIYELSPEVAEGSLLRRVEPDYPEQARQQQIQGPVVLDVRAGRDGSIQEIKLLSGQPLLADAAIAAVKQWRFRPLKIKGQPVEMETKVTLNFKLPH